MTNRATGLTFLGVPVMRPGPADVAIAVIVGIIGVAILSLLLGARPFSQVAYSFATLFVGSMLSGLGFSFTRYPGQTLLMLTAILCVAGAIGSMAL